MALATPERLQEPLLVRVRQAERLRGRGSPQQRADLSCRPGPQLFKWPVGGPRAGVTVAAQCATCAARHPERRGAPGMSGGTSALGSVRSGLVGAVGPKGETRPEKIGVIGCAMSIWVEGIPADRSYRCSVDINQTIFPFAILVQWL